MKLPRLSRGAGRHRSTDPLGDPLADSDDSLYPDAQANAADLDGAVPAAVPRAEPAGPKATDPSTVVFDDGDALGHPDSVPPAAPDPTAPPDADIELDLGLDPNPADETRRSARGMLAKLFGESDGRGGDSLSGLSDLDGRPLRRRRGAGLAGAGAAVVLLGLGGWLLWPEGSPPPQDGPDPDTAAAEGAPGDGNGSETEAGGPARVNEPDRVVVALPPLSAAPAEDGAEGPDGEVVRDPTAATDRSSARRPWLGGGDADADAAGPDAPDAGPDAAPDAGPDAAPDAAPDAGPDAAPDAGPASESELASAPPSAQEPAEDPALASVEPAPANPWQDMEQRGTGGEGVRARVDLAAPTIDLPDLPGLLPIPASVHRVVAPEGPNRLSDTPPIPRYADLSEAAGTRGAPLREAPLAKLVGRSSHGAIPRVAEDGTRPWQAYGAPDPASTPDQPRVAIVVSGLGMMNDALDAAVSKLPPAVTLSFSPYAVGLREKQGLARSAGHEVMLDLPMESAAFPATDPGPLGLMTLLPAPEAGERLERILAKGRGYVGVLAAVEGPFTNTPDTMEPVLATLSKAGLLYLHQGAEQSLIANRRVAPALTTVNVVIDERGFAESIEARLDYLTRLARARGVAVGVMTASPLGFTKLKAWADDLAGAGVALVPVSAAVQRARAISETGGAPTGAAAPPGAGTAPGQSRANKEEPADHG